ncbi:hypothetical protein J6590_018653 [Homalodisca vitripennis]|nr:hypothetical protein J6590_018653 [Homalodisca vitripennis]
MYTRKCPVEGKQWCWLTANIGLATLQLGGAAIIFNRVHGNITTANNSLVNDNCVAPLGMLFLGPGLLTNPQDCWMKPQEYWDQKKACFYDWNTRLADKVFLKWESMYAFHAPRNDH